jgi:hypothetical protein
MVLAWAKVKVMNECGGGGKTPLIPNLGTRCMWVVTFMIWPLYSPEKECLVRGQQSRSERFEVKHFIL